MPDELTEYKITAISGAQTLVKGLLIGAYLGVRRVPAPGQTITQEWVVDHLPTGFRVIQVRSKHIALCVARDLHHRCGEKLHESDNAKTIEVMGGKKIGRWVKAIREAKKFRPYANFS